MPILDLYHGANGRKMLYNIEHQGLTPDNLGQLYFAQHRWENCLVHGADRELHASIVCKLRVDIPDIPAYTIDRTPRTGNPDALIVTGPMNVVVRCEFLEMYARTGNREDGFQVETVPGPAIEAYLRSRFP